MQALQIFNYQNAQVRTVAIDGDPWFVANDVCEILELGNPRTSLAKLDEDEKGVHIMDTLGGPQEMTVINEPGLYALVLKSRKKEAKAFKRWITHEVLPSIRKTGSYSVQRDPITEIDRMAGMMNQMIPAIAGSLGEIRSTISEQGDRLAAVEERQKEIDPQVIDAYRVRLHAIKKALVAATKGKPQPVNWDSFWRELKTHCGVGSFDIRNQAALTVPTMEKAFAYAVEWCKARNVKVPAFDDLLSQ